MCKYLSRSHTAVTLTRTQLANQVARHDCPCHGEYEEFSAEKDIDGRNPASKEDSIPEDANSDSDNGMSHNLRKRVVAEPHVLRRYRIQLEPVAYNDNDVESVQEFHGMNDDGTITGTWNRTGDRGQPGFPDTELCSAHCFWKVWVSRQFRTAHD